MLRRASVIVIVLILVPEQISYLNAREYICSDCLRIIRCDLADILDLRVNSFTNVSFAYRSVDEVVKPSYGDTLAGLFVLHSSLFVTFVFSH